MPFKQILKELVESTPQAVGAIVVDWEGEAVQEYCHCDQYDIRFIAAHAGIILGRIRELHDAGQGGMVEDVLVTSSSGHLVIGGIDQDYSLVMNIDRRCPVDLALHHFRAAIVKLRKEI